MAVLEVETVPLLDTYRTILTHPGAMRSALITFLKLDPVPLRPVES